MPHFDLLHHRPGQFSGQGKVAEQQRRPPRWLAATRAAEQARLIYLVSPFPPLGPTTLSY